MAKISVGVLGATGLVGQAIVQMLDGHPWFEVKEVAASERSVGKSYEEVMRERWSISPRMPDKARGLMVKECLPKLECDIVLSALDSSVAHAIEEEFARAGYPVSSNARNHRMESDVPLLIPEINAGHVELIKAQRRARKWDGFIVTDPNCSTIHMCIALKPLIDAFGVNEVMVTTLQAVSGAGYPGVPSMDIIDNVIPFIGNEEEKMETEPLKIFGKLSGNGIKQAAMTISAQCNRVPVRHGHIECVSVKLAEKAGKEEIIEAFRNFRPLKGLGLPSAPANPVIYTENENRPQPKLDANAENGMASVVGRLRECKILDYKFVVLGHNLIRGAAGAAILNAELLKVKGYI